VSVARPSTEADLVDIVHAANADEAPIEIVGGASKRISGNNFYPHVETCGLTGIISYEPTELVMTVRAGTALATVIAALDERNQMLAFDPPVLADATIGGVIATNSSGPRRLRHGAARDHFLGFRAVSGRGEAFKAGGKVVKNVTGYDLPKLIAGSWGTLAILTEVTVKVMPKPAVEVTLIIKGLTDDRAINLFTTLMGGAHEIAAATHISDHGDGSSITALRIEGFQSSVAARQATLIDQLGNLRVLYDKESSDFWCELRDAIPLSSDSRPLWRIMLPPAHGPVMGLDGLMRFDWAGALRWLRSDDEPAAIHAAANAAHGFAQYAARNGPALSRFGELAALQERVRAGFDPNHILNRSMTKATQA
jgi:glycolate oxidase FAD binding subunit